MGLHVRIVSPVYSAFDGMASYVVVPAVDGEMGIAPLHASEICAVDRGLVRICDAKMGQTDHVIAIGEGYVQIAGDEVVILTERARDLAKIDRDEVASQLAGFEDELGVLSENDARRSYLYNEVAWCKLLLA